MMSEKKLWPLNQFLDWLEKVNSKLINIKSNDISVIIAILKFTNKKTLECYPSIEKICRLTLKDKKSVRIVLKRLVKNEIFTIKKRFTQAGDRDSNLYKFNPEKLWI